MAEPSESARGASSTEDDDAPVLVDTALLIIQGEGGDAAVEAECERARAFAAEHGIALHEVAARTFFDSEPPEDAPRHWIVIGEDRVLMRAMDAAEGREVGLGLLPAGKLTRTRGFYDLPADGDARLALAFRAPELALDVLRCNGELVLGQAAVGDVPFLDRRGQALVHVQERLWQRWAMAASLFWTACRRLFVITPSVIRMHLGREEKPRRTAITGIVLLENDVDSAAGRMLGEALSARDGRVTALVLAPTSVVRYLGFLLRAAVGRSGPPLPRALSYVRTEGLVIESDVELDYRVDGMRHRASRIEVTVNPQALRMNVGARFDGMAGIDENGKDTLKLGDLPENESRLALIRKRLPLFTHALEEDFKDLFLLLKDSARIGPDYLTLSVLSALIGTLGLLLDSAAVIIGAMVLAPLMAPIICLSMAALRRDFGLLRQSATAIGVGVGLSLAVSALVALLVPMRMLTPEIAARLAPSLIDLGVAVFSGVAGAYAYARESIMKSLPGVAIAVALVPPLAVAGIGVGWWDGGIVLGAGLLFLTNLVGIALAGAATFMVLGYGPVKRTTHGLLYPAAAAVLVAIPLALSYARMHFVWQAERQLAHSVYRIDGRTLELARPMVSVDGGLVRIRADVYVDGAATDADFAALRDRIARELDREVELDITVRARYR
ncbi:DUF389 domain-containing protein [Algiphilus sp.]|uniref:DUF389 domain-containing protein n=1 Tax=Algiphilus sp. TaxID=1872431 RepID=UPI003C585F21